MNISLRMFVWLALLSAILITPIVRAATPTASNEVTAQQQEEFEKALAVYKRNANMGYMAIMISIGETAGQGNPLALAWLQREASQNSDAMIALGYYFANKEDGNNALAQFKKAAQLGNADALTIMANAYDDGLYGVRKDPKTSCEWRGKAAEAGNFRDAVEYSTCLAQGIGGTRRDMNEACRWGEVGANGHEKSLASLQKDFPDFFNSPRGRSNKTSAARAYAIFALCLQDNPDTKSRIAEAAKWYKQSAELGFKYSSFVYGGLLEQGRGVVQNYVEAARWYREAAEGGYAEAQNRLGAKYAEGKGVQKNMVEAMKWFMIAAANGDEKAIENRDKAEKSLSAADVKKAQGLAAEWMKKNNPR